MCERRRIMHEIGLRCSLTTENGGGLVIAAQSPAPDLLGFRRAVAAATAPPPQRQAVTFIQSEDEGDVKVCLTVAPVLAIPVAGVLGETTKLERAIS